MSRKPKTKRRKIWYCIDCRDYIEPDSRRYHKGHRGRYGHPTTLFFEQREKFRLPNGEEVWMEKESHVAGTMKWKQPRGLLNPWEGIK